MATTNAKLKIFFKDETTVDAKKKPLQCIKVNNRHLFDPNYEGKVLKSQGYGKPSPALNSDGKAMHELTLDEMKSMAEDGYCFVVMDFDR